MSAANGGTIFVNHLAYGDLNAIGQSAGSGPEPFPQPGTNIWNQFTSISPTGPPAAVTAAVNQGPTVANGALPYHTQYLSMRLLLNTATGVLPSRWVPEASGAATPAYVAGTEGAFSLTQLIPPNFSPDGGYAAVLTDAAGTVIPYDGQTWYVDESTLTTTGVTTPMVNPGQVVFPNGAPSGPLTIKFYRYTGTTAATGGGGGGGGITIVANAAQGGSGNIYGVLTGSTLQLNQIAAGAGIAITQPSATTDPVTVAFSGTFAGPLLLNSTGASPTQIGATSGGSVGVAGSSLTLNANGAALLRSLAGAATVQSSTAAAVTAGTTAAVTAGTAATISAGTTATLTSTGVMTVSGGGTNVSSTGAPLSLSSNSSVAVAGPTIALTGATNINTTGSAATTIGNATGAVAITGPTTINTSGSLTTTIGNSAAAVVVTGPTTINATGTAATTIGNTTGVVAVTGPTNLNTTGTAVTTIGNAAAAVAITGPTTVNTAGSASTSIGNATGAVTVTGPANVNTTGTAATTIGNATGAVAITGPVTVNATGTAATTIGNATGAVAITGPVTINTTGTAATTIGNTTGILAVAAGAKVQNLVTSITTGGTSGITVATATATGAVDIGLSLDGASPSTAVGAVPLFIDRTGPLMRYVSLVGSPTVTLTPSASGGAGVGVVDTITLTAGSASRTWSWVSSAGETKKVLSPDPAGAPLASQTNGVLYFGSSLASPATDGSIAGSGRFLLFDSSNGALRACTVTSAGAQAGVRGDGSVAFGSAPTANTNYSTVAGGNGNGVYYQNATNADSTTSICCFIGAGAGNHVNVSGSSATNIPVNNVGIVCGTGNVIKGSVTDTSQGFIGGGSGNTVQDAANAAVVGGATNTVKGASAGVLAGTGNSIDASGTAGASAQNSCIGAGSGNAIAAATSAVGSGTGNTIRVGTVRAAPADAFIAGGNGNDLLMVGAASILGGRSNWIRNLTTGGTATTGDYSVIAGGSTNRIETIAAVSPTAVLAMTISGGQNNFITCCDTAVIAGGVGNIIGRANVYTAYGVIGGGNQNIVRVSRGVIGGGELNAIYADAASGTDSAAIMAGTANLINGNGVNPSPVVSGPTTISVSGTTATTSAYSLISGGQANSIARWGPLTTSTTPGPVVATVCTGNGSRYATIGGGTSNAIGNDCSYSVIGGGLGNFVTQSRYPYNTAGYASAYVSGAGVIGGTISGGSTNAVLAGSNYSAIGGGLSNTIGNDGYSSGVATFSFIGGGSGNTIDSGGFNTSGNVIGGGTGNYITGTGHVISGGGSAGGIGFRNQISGGTYSAVGGGQGNTQYFDTSFSVIAGGSSNTIGNASFSSALTQYMVIGGGAGNTIDPSGNVTISGSAILSGFSNYLSGNGHVICGGGAANGGTSTNRNQIIGGGYSFIGGGSNNQSTSSTYCIIVGGFGNQHGSSTLSVIGGGSTNQTTSATNCVIAGGFNNQIAGSYSAIGGGSDNQIGGGIYSGVVGGQANRQYFNASYSVINGGASNTIGNSSFSSALTQYMVIGGGAGNTIDPSGNVTILGSAILSGFSNYLSGSGHVICGGGAANGGTATNRNQIAGGSYSFIGGGSNNQASSATNCVITGGLNNQVAGSYNSVTGGYNNQILGTSSYSVICGGGSILSTEHNSITNGNACFIGSGASHAINGATRCGILCGGSNSIIGNAIDSAIICGALNSISAAATNSAIIGFGYNLSTAANGVLATGIGTNVSFASGIAGSFVWHDSTGTSTSVSGSNSFNVCAGGGFYFQVAGLTYSLNNSSGWQSSCDRALKENIADLDTAAIASKLLELPLYSYSYRADPTATTVWGPMAQDWIPTFAPQRTELVISNRDIEGVLLAGTQHALKECADLRAKNAELDSHISELNARVEALEAALANILARLP